MKKMVVKQVTVKKLKPMRSAKRRNSLPAKVELVREHFDEGTYEYYLLGEYVVVAPGVCGGRPTIKYHRLDARHVLAWVHLGFEPERIARDFEIPVEAVHETIALAKQYDYERSYA